MYRLWRHGWGKSISWIRTSRASGMALAWRNSFCSMTGVTQRGWVQFLGSGRRSSLACRQVLGVLRTLCLGGHPLPACVLDCSLWDQLTNGSWQAARWMLAGFRWPSLPWPSHRLCTKLGNSSYFPAVVDQSTENWKGPTDQNEGIVLLGFLNILTTPFVWSDGEGSHSGEMSTWSIIWTSRLRVDHQNNSWRLTMGWPFFGDSNIRTTIHIPRWFLFYSYFEL